ncbi:uncharacterized protein CMC5_035360 [Chondromyces crocatus]|uniref:Outer membrane protein beta-barrel domain-containing protein n=2 Tax=Chondromyces crocatus TaxID=52 RepID=A0A0K1EEV6_CHOCO|nr:uncharacterized protein CMC5_035360 [Chondromyces crocatus]
MRQTAVFAAALAGLTAAAGVSRADESRAARRAAAAFEQSLPFTQFTLGAGMLTLPAADVCPVALNRCEQGESSLSFSLHNLYRYGPLGLGAGIVWALDLSADRAPGDPELEREHSRSYFLVEAQFRYYGLRFDTWELWVGGTFGGVVVNDSWSVVADREPYADTAFIGPRAATLGTEGLAAGLGVGAEWTFADNWSFGAQVRYSNWFLPGQPEQLPTGDFASLKGRIDMFDLGLTIAYRIAL